MTDAIDPERRAAFARAVFGLADGTLVLASRSPRRREICERLGLRIRVVPPDVDERILPGETPGAHVQRLAAAKAARVARGHAEALVVGADTVVVLGDRMLGKPADPSEARRMLRDLSGRTHQVVTGVAVVRGEAQRVGSESTSVTFRELADGEIDAYVASGEPLDKAGSYGAQALGAAFVSHIEGCYYNVIGLPVVTLAALIRDLNGSAARGGEERPR